MDDWPCAHANEPRQNDRLGSPCIVIYLGDPNKKNVDGNDEDWNKILIGDMLAIADWRKNGPKGPWVRSAVHSRGCAVRGPCKPHVAWCAVVINGQ